MGGVDLDQFEPDSDCTLGGGGEILLYRLPGDRHRPGRRGGPSSGDTAAHSVPLASRRPRPSVNGPPSSQGARVEAFRPAWASCMPIGEALTLLAEGYGAGERRFVGVGI